MPDETGELMRLPEAGGLQGEPEAEHRKKSLKPKGIFGPHRGPEMWGGQGAGRTAIDSFDDFRGKLDAAETFSEVHLEVEDYLDSLEASGKTGERNAVLEEILERSRPIQQIDTDIKRALKIRDAKVRSDQLSRLEDEKAALEVVVRRTGLTDDLEDKAVSEGAFYFAREAGLVSPAQAAAHVEVDPAAGGPTITLKGADKLQGAREIYWDVARGSWEWAYMSAMGNTDETRKRELDARGWELPMTELVSEAQGAVQVRREAVAAMGGRGRMGMGMTAGAGYTEGEAEAYDVMESVPDTRQGWVDSTRKFIQKMLLEGESKYAPTTYPQRVRRYLVPVPRAEAEDRVTVDKLATEAMAVQGANKIAEVFKEAAVSAKGLEQLGQGFSAAGVTLDAAFFKRFSNWADTTVPAHLRACIERGKETESVSMSEMVDRSLLIYAGFLGEWAELEGKLMREAEKKVAPEARRERLWRKNPNEWENRVKAEYKKARTGLMAASTSGLLGRKTTPLEEVERRYSGYLNLPMDGDGKIDGKFVKGVFATMPEDLKRAVEKEGGKGHYWKLYTDVNKEKEGVAMRLVDMFGGKNVFCENSGDTDRAWTRWLAGALAGSDYGQAVALNLVQGTGEASQLNTTEATFGFGSDAFTHLTNLDIRQAGEGRVGAPVGSEHVAGRYAPVCRSMLRATKTEGTILENIRKGNKFSKLEWGKLMGEPGGGWAGVDLSRGLAVYGLINSPGADMGKEITEDAMEAMVKPFNTVTKDWYAASMYDRKTGKIGAGWKELSDWERRDKWASQHLDAGGNAPDDYVIDIRRLSEDDWPVPFTWALGTIMEHCPDGGVLPLELRSPYGIEPVRAAPGERWSSERPVRVTSGFGALGTSKIVNEKSVPMFLDWLVVKQVLTIHEARLLAATVREARMEHSPIKFHIPLKWKLPR